MKGDDLSIEEQAAKTQDRLLGLLDEMEAALREVREIVDEPEAVTPIDEAISDVRDAVANGDLPKGDA